MNRGDKLLSFRGNQEGTPGVKALGMNLLVWETKERLVWLESSEL